MKLTQQKIRQIIKEELKYVLSENIERYKKIFELFESDDLEKVKQAIKIGEDAGFFTRQDEKIIKDTTSEGYYDEINVYTCDLICHDKEFYDTFQCKVSILIYFLLALDE